MRKSPHSRLTAIVKGVMIIHALGGWIGYSHAEEEPEGPSTEAVSHKSKKSIKRLVLRTYSSQKDAFARVCRELSVDGRGEMFNAILLTADVRDPLCKACKGFFDSFITVCKRLSVKPTPETQGHGEAGPESEPEKGEVSDHSSDSADSAVSPWSESAEQKREIRARSREPHPALIDALTQLSISIRNSAQLSEQSYPVFMKLIAFMRAGQHAQTHADREYLDILATYLHAPWEGYEEELLELTQSSTGDQDLHREEQQAKEAKALFDS